MLDYDLHSRETYAEAGSGYTVVLASTEGGGGGIGGGLDPNSLITRTYSYTELNTMTLDEMRNESGTFSAGNYNFGSYSYSNVDKSLESRSESGTRATSMGTSSFSALTWTRKDEQHYKWGDGRVNTDDANFSYTKIDEAYSSSTLGGNSTSNYSINTTTNSGMFTMTDGELGNERTFVQAMLMEWVGPPIRISPEALAYARSLADGWEPFSVIDKTDGFFAGWADSLTAGLSTKARAYIYGDDATRNHKGKYFQGGQMVGAIHGTVLAFANPCAMGGVIGAAYRGIQAAGTVGGVINGVENLRKGEYQAAAWDFLGAAGDLASFLRACFAGDMQVLTRRGWVRWDALTEQDEVAARDETDPQGEVAYKQVEEIFRTTASILHVHIGREVLRTTAEHPFWVEGQGWTAAQDLQPGDKLVTLEGLPVVVSEVYATGDEEAVYNCRVAEYHTYFVGQDGWGVGVWAHNQCVKALRRRGMDVTVFRDPSGKRVLVYGLAQKAGKGHAAKIMRQVRRLVDSGEYKKIYLNRSWRTATGRANPSRLRPDIIGLRRGKNPVFNAWEFASPGQRPPMLSGRLNHGLNQLPSGWRGQGFVR